MIVWLNGAFGVGKTSVAKELVRQLPDARLCDPERIGFVMRRTFWRGRDYQDVALWRELTRRQVQRVGRKVTAVVPMTVVDRAVYETVTAGAQVFLLCAKEDVLRQRIAGSDVAQTWRSQQLNRCLTAFGSGYWGEPIQTDDLTPTETAALIARQVLGSG